MNSRLESAKRTTLATLQRRRTKNLKQIFPEMKLLGPVPNSYIPESVSYVYNYYNRSAYFAAEK
jgi:hypothetical protein